MLTFEAGYEIGDLGGLQLDVVESGGASFSVTISAGLYFLTVDAAAAAGDHADLVQSYASLLEEIQTQLQAGTATGANVWTVEFDTTAERVVFTLDPAIAITEVSITPVTGGGLVGLTGAVSGALSHPGQRVPDYWIASEVGFWSEWSGEYEAGDDGAWDVEAHDGAPGGVSKEGFATYLDMSIASEPVAKVGNYPRLVESSAPWTWRSLWSHCRNVEPFAMTDDDETYLLLMRAEGSKFEPRKQGSNYIARWDLGFQTRVLGRV